jgi:hypothetical protein
LLIDEKIPNKEKWVKMTTNHSVLEKVKSLNKKCFYLPSRLLRYIKVYMLGFRSAEQVFKKVYSENSWGDPESRSGPGSSLAQTDIVRQELKALVKELGATSMLDVPCGDFNWLSKVDLEVDYLGADIVQELVEENNNKFGNNGSRHFIKLDMIQDNLPQVDIILCRDVLVHFNNKQIFRAIKNIKQSNSKYLLTTTFPAVNKNINIVTGEWRALDLCKPPFNLPAPIKIIIEQCKEENLLSFSKCLGLWKISDI